MPSNDLENMFARLVQMEMAAVPGSDAVPISFYSQEGMPYWTNTVTGFTVELESEQLEIITYSITARLVLATLTEGINNQAELSLQTWLPVILTYFGQRRQLKRTSADTLVSGLDPRGAQITGGQVRDDIQNSGIGVNMFGIDFNIEVPMTISTDQLIF